MAEPLIVNKGGHPAAGEDCVLGEFAEGLQGFEDQVVGEGLGGRLVAGRTPEQVLSRQLEGLAQPGLQGVCLQLQGQRPGQLGGQPGQLGHHY